MMAADKGSIHLHLRQIKHFLHRRRRRPLDKCENKREDHAISSFMLDNVAPLHVTSQPPHRGLAVHHSYMFISRRKFRSDSQPAIDHPLAARSSQGGATMKGRLVRFAVFILMLLAVGACTALPAAAPPPPTPTPAPPTSTPDPAAPVRAYLEAFNRRDLDGALALLVDEGLVFWYPEGEIYRTKAELRTMLEMVVALGNTVEIISCEPLASGVRCIVGNRNDYCIKAFSGLDVAKSEDTYTFKDGKIQKLTSELLPEAASAMSIQAPKAAAWMQANRPDDFSKYTNPTAYNLAGRAVGEVGNPLCKAYLESQK
jgi:hypothetical protein